jgi:hypothetical protein
MDQTNNKKEFKCQYCQQIFTYKGSLTKHEKKCSNNKEDVNKIVKVEKAPIVETKKEIAVVKNTKSVNDNLVQYSAQSTLNSKISFLETENKYLRKLVDELRRDKNFYHELSLMNAQNLNDLIQTNLEAFKLIENICTRYNIELPFDINAYNAYMNS